MAHIFAQQNVIAILSASAFEEVLPPEVITLLVANGIDVKVNPFKNQIEYLDKTMGRWMQENEFQRREMSAADVRRFGSGRKFFAKQISDEFGVASPSAEILYRSPYFNSWELPLSMLPSAFGLFGALQMYFEIVDYPAFVQLADQQYDNQTPDFLPNSRPVDDKGNITKVTWDKWMDATHTHLSNEGQNYVPLNSNTGGQNLAGSMLFQLIAAGYTVKPMSEWPVIDGGT